jgi:UDP-N-acetylglucosamine--N-acetylmuramyl-(pentapeptide) pyrophosphoryl-undecaprenol N-acetylglucosamine transferase
MKTVRVVHYAINGRGMGHLVRQLAIARWMRRYAAVLGVKLEHWVLTSSEADTLARREGMLSLKIPSKSMMRDAGVDPARYLAIARSWVLQTLVGLQPDLLVVDTFPAGSFGELLASLELVPQRALVARPVRAEVEQQEAWQALLPLYGRVIVPDEGGVGPILIREPEELPDRPAARAALGLPDGARAVWVSLGGGGDPAAPSVLPRLVDGLRARGWYVVVAAGPLYQGEERRGEGVVWLDRYVGVELLPGVDAAVSAGGYNAWHELMMVGVPTVFLPQPRIADDQDGRAQRAVAAGVARQARALEEVPALLEELLTAGPTPDAARALVPAGGARRAAAELLAMVLPPADVRAAARAFPASLLAHPAARALDARRLVEVVRWLAGEAPSRWAERRADVLDLVDRGLLRGELPKDPPRGAPVEEFLRLAAPAPAESAEVLAALVRRWPAAAGPELLAACARLLPVFARFEDWPGAVALLRALPQQRTWPLAACAEALATWLGGERDLFDAQRALVRTSASGRRSLAESLHLLQQGGAQAPEGLL